MQAAERGSPSDAVTVTSTVEAARPIAVWTTLHGVLSRLTLLHLKWCETVVCMCGGTICLTLVPTPSVVWMTACERIDELHRLAFLLFRVESDSLALAMRTVPPEA